MVELIEQQLGRILLGVAVVWTVTAAWINNVPQVEFPEEKKVKDEKAVQVELDETTLKTANPEIFFPDRGAEDYRGRAWFPFVPPVKTFIFEPVELKVPTTDLMRPPQLLPSPGPSLEGTHGLPRWGEEFPALKPPETDSSKRR